MPAPAQEIVTIIRERYIPEIKPLNRIVQIIMPTRCYLVVAPVGFYPVRGQQSFTECAHTAETFLRKGFDDEPERAHHLESIQKWRAKQ